MDTQMMAMPRAELHKILEYLADKPYREVHEMILAIQSSQPVTLEEKSNDD